MSSFGLGPASTSSGNPLEVDVDRTHRVVGVRIARLPDELRESAALDRAFREALARGLAEERPPAPLELDAAGRPVVRRVQLPARRPLRELVAEAARGGHTMPPRGSEPLPGGERGVSDNDCLEVVLDAAGQGGSLTAEPGWLRQATAPNVATAITQAFTAAYQERDNR
jgi:hypothetical protein